MKQSTYIKWMFSIFAFFLTINLVKAQVPQSFSYQAMARNASGVLSNQSIGVRFSITDNNTIVYYSERQAVTTNSTGLFTCNVGTGTVLSGGFALIDWSTGNNKYKFSYKDATSGLFRIPDTRDMFLRNTGTRTAATFQDHALMTHRHINPAASNNGSLPFGKSLLNIINATIFGTGTSSTNKNPLTSDPCDSSGTVLTSNVDSETRPKNVTFNHFIYT